MLRTLRGVGDDLVLTVPREFVHRHGLADGSRVALHLVGKRMIVELPSRPCYKLADLFAEMPEGLPRMEEWEQIPSVGAENNRGDTGPARKGLMRFAASQKNIDRLAARLAFCVAALGALVAIATIAALVARWPRG